MVLTLLFPAAQNYTFLRNSRYVLQLRKHIFDGPYSHHEFQDVFLRLQESFCEFKRKKIVFTYIHKALWIWTFLLIFWFPTKA